MSTYPQSIMFHELDLDSVLAHQGDTCDKALDSLPRQNVDRATVEDSVQDFVERYTVAPIVLLEGAASSSVEEVQVDVSRDPGRYISDRSQPFFIPGIQVEYYVPFKGDPTLFRCRPNSFDFNPPRAEVRGNELVFAFRRSDSDAAATKSQFDGQLSKVKTYLSRMEGQLASFNESLPGRIRSRLDARLQRLDAMATSMASVGLPPRSTVAKPAQVPERTRTRQNRQSQESDIYDVSFSFAGEDRAYVEAVATILKSSGVSVFYDLFEKASLWGKNLVDHLADIYRNRSRFVVMFISEHYVAKAWPKHERQHAQERALVSNQEYILPARFDDSEVPGLAGTVGYIDLKQLSAREFADILLRKIGKK